MRPAKRAVRSIDESETAAGYDEKYRSGHWSYNYDLERKRLEGTLNAIGLKGGKALELGCGEGFHAKLLFDLGFTVTANDLSRVAIERATEAYPEVDFIHGDSGKLIERLESESFDLILVRGHSWYHYQLTSSSRKGIDVPALTGVVFRLIRPGGFFVLFVKTDFTGTDDGVVNNRYGDYLELFQRFGEVVRVTDWSGTPLENEEAALKSGFNIAISTRKPEQALCTNSQRNKTAERRHFSEVAYWLERHERMRDDPRSVGNLGRSLDENLEGQKEQLQRLRSALSVLFPVVEGQSALDLACGVGRLAPALVEMGFEYTGVDISPVALEQARGVCPLGSFVEGNIVTYRPPQTYDLVIAAYVLVHLVEDADWQAALDTIAASMKPEGLFLLIDNVPIVRQSPAEHVVNRSLSDYKAALRARNLAISGKLKQDIVKQLPLLRSLKDFYFIKRMS